MQPHLALGVDGIALHQRADDVPVLPQGLLGAVPRLGSSLAGEETRLSEIPGLVPSLKQRIEGCVFAGRCAKVTEICRKVAPRLVAKAPGHSAACHHAETKAVAA